MPHQLRPRTKIARRLRADSTGPEHILWRALRERLPDYKFRRQHPIGNRIADFACPAKKLVIELDGSQHADEQDADNKRTTELAAYGYRVIRFWNNDVTENLASVLDTVYRELETPPTSPYPLRPGGAEREINKDLRRSPFMKAVVTKSDNSGCELVERPVPTPGHGEVLIKIAAAGINGADLSQAKGRYPVPAGATDILGLEASGEITALGAGVSQWKVGDKVCALLVGGGYAEYVAVPAVQCLPVPKGLSVIEAAALPECVITVWLNVFDLGALKAGDRLLVHGGSSGIGTTAIQIASALGSPVVITAGSAEKCQRCTALGATLAIDYNAQDYVEAIESAFGKRSIDVSLNMVGGDYVMRDIRLLAQGGRLVMIAARKGSKIDFDYQALTEKDGRITGSRLRPRPIQEKGRLAAAVRKAVWPLIETGKFKPVIDKTYPLSEIEAAHKHMAGAHIGKILLTL